MNRDNPTSRKLLNVTLLVLLSPLYAVFLFKSEFGVLRILGPLVSEGRAFASPLLYLLLLGYIASMVWLLWRGSALGPVVILFVTMLLYSFSNISGIREKRYELQIGAGQPMLGIDVYCNGINLGRTPLRISEAEFCEKVTPWKTPPKQPRLSIEKTSLGDTDRFGRAKYFYVPQDIFEMYKAWPPNQHRYFKFRNKAVFEEMGGSQYWWRFEKDGCLGLTSLHSFGGGAGGGRTITIDINPNVEFPSAIRHLGLLVHHLANSDYQPGPQWLEHFLKYKGLLIMEFYKRAKGDEKLQPALRALVRAEFGIPEEPSERDCARVVDEILDRVEKVGCFTVPSLESLAIELVGQAHYRPIVDRFLESLRVPGGGSSGIRSSDIWTTYRRSGKRVRQLPLEYAVRKLCPDELYNRLIYMSRNGAYLDIIGNYQREESVRLITYHLRQVERQGGRFQRVRMTRAMRLCAKIHNPQLEGTLRNFIRNNAGGRDNEFGVREFIQSRINTADPNSSDVANWIFHSAPLRNDRDKLEYISKLNTSQTHHYLNMLLPRGNQSLREDMIFQLSRNPNLSLDQFIIDSYKWYNSSQGAGHYLANLTDAIVNTDTPAMRRFLTDLWNKAGKDRKTLLRHLQYRQWRAPNMNWLTPLFAELTGKDECLMAAKILSKIDNDDAWQLAEKWAKDTDPDIAATARQQLDIRRNRLEDEQQFIRQANELIAGKIKPDELLPSGPAYVWNEQEYVSQTQDNKK